MAIHSQHPPHKTNIAGKSFFAMNTRICWQEK